VHREEGGTAAGGDKAVLGYAGVCGLCAREGWGWFLRWRGWSKKGDAASGMLVRLIGERAA